MLKRFGRFIGLKCHNYSIYLCIFLNIYTHIFFYNYEKQVVMITNDLPLSDNERSVLKGLHFNPLEKSFHHFTVRQHVKVFFRRLRLQAYHHNQSNI